MTTTEIIQLLSKGITLFDELDRHRFTPISEVTKDLYVTQIEEFSWFVTIVYLMCQSEHTITDLIPSLLVALQAYKEQIMAQNEPLPEAYVCAQLQRMNEDAQSLIFQFNK